MAKRNDHPNHVTRAKAQKPQKTEQQCNWTHATKVQHTIPKTRRQTKTHNHEKTLPRHKNEKGWGRKPNRPKIEQSASKNRRNVTHQKRRHKRNQSKHNAKANAKTAPNKARELPKTATSKARLTTTTQHATNEQNTQPTNAPKPTKRNQGAPKLTGKKNPKPRPENRKTKPSLAK
ncbi:hypothetical protein [Pacificibacter marinus]|uniref:hypothetical protein n=1 Tax=Pacificibacter marinus TaxID=658057 RepID=UPI001113D62A|nr:hypothetical protein [Pacificibacter marinus]